VVIELAPLVPAAAPVVAAAPAEPDRAEPQFGLQLASMRTSDGAYEEMNRLKRLHANLLASVDLTVQRTAQGERGVFYRVLSAPVGDRPDAAQLCTVIAQKRGQCAVIALRPTPSPAVETHVAAMPAPTDAAPQQAAAAPQAAPAEPLVPAPIAAPVAAASPSAPATVARAETISGGSEVRAQLGSMRSMEGAAREVARLSRIYGPTLGATELSVSRIDQGERGVFYRILTAPLPSRDAGADLCQRLGNSHQAGCVLIPGRPTA
jgi:hypothetical protein